jgi:hypothetical protein
MHVSIFSGNIGPHNSNGVTGSKSVSLVALYQAVEDVLIASAELSPVFIMLKFSAQDIGPGWPDIGSKATTKREQPT